FPAPSSSAVLDAGLPAPVNALRQAGFRDDHFSQQRQSRFQLLPNPPGDVLARRIFQAWNLVEVTVVQLFEQRFERLGDVGVVHQPTELRITPAGGDDFRTEAVAVQATALVRGGQIWQQVSRFELKGFSQFDIHCSQSVQVTSSPKAGRPSWRQVRGGFCISPTGQMRVTPQRPSSVARRSARLFVAARPTAETWPRTDSAA